MLSKAMNSLSVNKSILLGAHTPFSARNALKPRPVRNSSSEDVNRSKRPRSSFLNVDSAHRNIFFDNRFGHLEKENVPGTKPKYTSSNNLFKQVDRSPSRQSLIDLRQRRNLVFPKLKLHPRPNPPVPDW